MFENTLLSPTTDIQFYMDNHFSVDALLQKFQPNKKFHISKMMTKSILTILPALL